MRSTKWMFPYSMLCKIGRSAWNHLQIIPYQYSGLRSKRKSVTRMFWRGEHTSYLRVHPKGGHEEWADVWRDMSSGAGEAPPGRASPHLEHSDDGSLSWIRGPAHERRHLGMEQDRESFLLTTYWGVIHTPHNLLVWSSQFSCMCMEACPVCPVYTVPRI